MMIPTEASRNGLVIEYLVDNLFDEGLRGHVARLLCKGRQPVTPERVQEIAESARNMFPREFESSRKSSLTPLVAEVKRDIDEFLANPNEVSRMVAELGLPPEWGANA
jgi:hypothetical protein